MEVKNEVGIPPYNCEICDRDFTRKDSLTRHIKSHHDNETEVKCDFCNKTFISTGRLNYHTREVHSNKKGMLAFQWQSCLFCMVCWQPLRHGRFR